MKIEDIANGMRCRRDGLVGTDNASIDGDGLGAPGLMRNQDFYREEPQPRLFQRFVMGAALDEPGQTEKRQVGPQTEVAIALHAQPPERARFASLPRRPAVLVAYQTAIFYVDDAVGE